MNIAKEKFRNGKGQLNINQMSGALKSPVEKSYHISSAL
jgi:hypothetical protein